MTVKEFENWLYSPDDKKLEKADKALNPENAQDAKEISRELVGNAEKLQWELQKPENLQRIKDTPEYRELKGQLNSLKDVVNDPSIHDLKTGKISGEWMKKIENAYNTLMESFKVLHGMVHGAPGKATQERDEQMQQNNTQRNKEKENHFAKWIEEREDQKAQEQARRNAKEATKLNEIGARDMWKTSPKVETLAVSNLERWLEELWVP